MRLIVTLAAFLSLASLSSPAAAKVRIAATIPALGAIAKEVAGPEGSVSVLAPPLQDPHFVDGKPSMILTLNRAQLLIHAGRGLESGWLPPLLTNARNGDIQLGKDGNLDASTVAGPLLEADTPLDRSLGDVHPGGNPHYWLDLRRAPPIADAVAERLARLDPTNATRYRSNAARFRAEVQAKVRGWEQVMAPYRGRGLVPYHKSLVYLEEWLGLKELSTIEPLPGIAPSPSHLAKLILEMRGLDRPPLVVSEPWHNLRTAETVAQKAGAKLVRLPGDVGSIRGKERYLDHMEELLARLRAGFGDP